MSARIIERGRGPELEGTRITIYRIMDFLRSGESAETIARDLELTDEQVQAALEYIQAHHEAVETAYQKILNRVNGPNPDWLQRRLSQSSDELKRRLRDRRRDGASHADSQR